VTVATSPPERCEKTGASGCSAASQPPTTRASFSSTGTQSPSTSTFWGVSPTAASFNPFGSAYTVENSSRETTSRESRSSFDRSSDSIFGFAGTPTSFGDEDVSSAEKSPDGSSGARTSAGVDPGAGSTTPRSAGESSACAGDTIVTTSTPDTMTASDARTAETRRDMWWRSLSNEPDRPATEIAIAQKLAILGMARLEGSSR